MKYIIFDANAILDLYSYTKSTITGLVAGFKELEKDSNYKVFFPRQVLFEFYKNHVGCRKASSSKMPFVNIRNEFKVKKDKLIRDCNKCKNENVLSKRFDESFNNLIDELRKTTDKYDDIIRKIDELESKIPVSVPDDDEKDIVYQFIKSHSYVPFTYHEKVEMASRADFKLNHDIYVPGNTDIKKSQKEKDPFARYGDYFVWEEILLLKDIDSSEEVFFIENELKADWWTANDRAEFQPELVKEFKICHPNTKLTALNFYSFMDKFIGFFDSNTKMEVRNVTQQYKSIINEQKYLPWLQNLFEDYIYDFDFEENMLYEDRDSDYGYIKNPSLFKPSKSPTILIRNVDLDEFLQMVIIFDYIQEVKIECQLELEKSYVNALVTMNVSLQLEVQIGINIDENQNIGYECNSTELLSSDFEIINYEEYNPEYEIYDAMDVDAYIKDQKIDMENL